MKDTIRYSEGFKLQVLQELRDKKWTSVPEAALAYDITSASIYSWINKFGFSYLKGRMIYVKTKSELDEIKRLKDEVKKLKELLSDEVLEHKIDAVTLRIACRELKKTPDELKKKAVEKL